MAFNIYSMKSSLKVLYVEDEVDQSYPCLCIALLPYADSQVMSLLNPEMELPSLSI